MVYRGSVNMSRRKVFKYMFSVCWSDGYDEKTSISRLASVWYMESWIKSNSYGSLQSSQNIDNKINFK